MEYAELMELIGRSLAAFLPLPGSVELEDLRHECFMKVGPLAALGEPKRLIVTAVRNHARNQINSAMSDENNIGKFIDEYTAAQRNKIYRPSHTLTDPWVLRPLNELKDKQEVWERRRERITEGQEAHTHGCRQQLARIPVGLGYRRQS
jgi:hypothetical protein